MHTFSFNSKRPHTITKMNDNINMDSRITVSFNVYDAEEKDDSYYKFNNIIFRNNFYSKAQILYKWLMWIVIFGCYCADLRCKKCYHLLWTLSISQWIQKIKQSSHLSQVTGLKGLGRTGLIYDYYWVSSSCRIGRFTWSMLI